MYKLYDSGLSRRIRRAAWFFCLLALGPLAALESNAQPPPPNDLLTNGQVVLGLSGQTTGSNLFATAEPGEPPPDGVDPAGATIWYVWTAPENMTMDFNTRGSTDPFGNELDTVLAVYTRASAVLPVSVNNLALVTNNDDDISGGVVSRVDFAATAGTTYYIQVDGSAKSFGTNDEGTVVLSWGSSHVGGTFRFTSTRRPNGNPVFLAGEFDDEILANDSTINPSLANPAGSPNVRVTITRQGGFTGRCEVQLIVTNNSYTNLFNTNYFGTNVYITNYLDAQQTQIAGWTNSFYTNVNVDNVVQDDVYGIVDTLGLKQFYTIQGTNSSGKIPTINTTEIFCTNLPNPNCQNASFGPITNLVTSTVNGVSVTNYIISWTNVFCSFTATPELTPSAVDGVAYSSFDSTNVTFDDFEMSKDVYLTVNPSLGPDWPDTNGNDIAYGINSRVILQLTNAVLDPQEDPDITPPTIDPVLGQGELNILSIFGTPPNGTNCVNQNYTVFNFERETFRVDKTVNLHEVTIYVYRVPVGGPAEQVSYTIDSTSPVNRVIDYNNFDLEAGSDYAVPQDSINPPVYDFSLPFAGNFGVLTWAANDINPKAISIPLNDNGAVEFNEDIYVQLFKTTADDNADQNPIAVVGYINTANITILPDMRVGERPGGALDTTHNPDNSSGSYPPFNPVPGANLPVQAVATQTDGTSVIGGSFTDFDSNPINRIARLQANGLLDPTFNPGSGANDVVSAIVYDSAGRIIIGGGFTSFNGSSNITYHIARLNTDGSLDTSFNSQFGANGAIYALALDSSGNILIGGDFTSYNTTPINHIARILTNGILDTTFNPGSGTDGDVYAIALDSNGNIIIGGQFSYVNGTNYNGVARLLPSGTLDTTFGTISGADGPVYSLAVLPNNRIIVAGGFTHYNLTSRNSITRLNTNGSVDTSFDPGTGANDVIYTTVLQPDGNILIGGAFTSYNTTRRIGIARLLPQGWLDTYFMDTSYNQFAGLINHYYNTNAVNPADFPAYFNTRNSVHGMALEPDGNVMIGGTFLQIGGGGDRHDRHIRVNVARLSGPATPGATNGAAGDSPGGLGNAPGNITFIQNPYTVDDTAGKLYTSIQRTNGSLGRLTVTLSTNTLPPGPGAATSKDFGLINSMSEYESVWDHWFVFAANNEGGLYSWRISDGYYGYNYAIQPLSDFGASKLYLGINNSGVVGQNIFGDLSLLSLSGYDIFYLGGEDVPLAPAFGQSAAQLEIINDNFYAGTLGFSMTNYSVIESSNYLTVTVLRTNGSTGPVTVQFTTQNGFTNDPGVSPAIAGTDYVKTNGTLSFGDGQVSASFQVRIIDHSTMQPNKFLNVLVFAATGGATFDTNNPPILPTNSVVTIVDDHFQPGHLSFNSSGFTVTKGGVAAITVNRTGGALGGISVQMAVSGGTAINGVNFVGSTNTLTWANGDISPKTNLVQTIEDGVVEGNKTVNLSLTNPLVAGSLPLSPTNSYVIGSPSNAVLTILEDDFYGTLNFAVPNFNVLNNAGAATITVVRTGGTIGPLSVDYAIFNGTNVPSPYQPAYAGTNYSTVSGTLNFPAGISSETFTVPIIYDPTNNVPANRIADLVLSNPNPTNVLGFQFIATLTILDSQLVLSPAGFVDTTALFGTGFNDFVNSLSLQPDGKLLAGGNFTGVNQIPFGHVARLNTDGSVDTGFLANAAGANNNIRAVLSEIPTVAGQTNTEVMIGGDFTQVNGVNLNRVARMNFDGSLDETFNPGSGADGTVYAVVETVVASITNGLPISVTNGTATRAYIIAGAFANFNGVPCNGVTRLMANGSVDPNFTPGLGVTGPYATVYAAAVQPNGQILLGGDFISFNNTTHDHLVRLNIDGSVDNTFNPDTGADVTGSVRAIAVQSDGKILIGGLFTTVNGSNYNHIARLNSDGTLDANFVAGAGANDSVFALAVDSQQRIMVGGEFTSASGVTRNGITRLNPDGSLDATMNFGSGANSFVSSIVIQSDDEVDVGGGFTMFNGTPQNHITRLYGGAVAGPGSIEFQQTAYGVMQNGTNATITIQRIGGTVGSVTVTFYTTDGTGMAGVDYVGTTNTLTFPQGETFQTVTIPIINNSIVSGDKTVNLNLSGDATIGPQVPAILYITNANTAVSFSSATYRESEAVSGGSAQIPVVRSGNPNSTLTVTMMTTTNGSAVPFVNFVPQTNTLIFNPGVLTVTDLVQVLDATNQFSDLTLGLQLVNPIGGFLASPNNATLTIASANAGPGMLAFSQTNYVVSENPAGTNALITIIRTNGVTGPVSVTFATSNGTAVAGINYEPTNLIVNFGDGEMAKTISIPIIQQTQAGPDTTVYLILSNPQGGATIGGTNIEVLTIQNDLINFTFSSPAYFISEGASTLTLSILRNGPTNGTVTVGYTTYAATNAFETNGFAIPGVDYVQTNGSVTFLPGETLETVPVQILQGNQVNPPEVFYATLINSNNAPATQLGTPSTTTVTIISDVTGFNFSTNAYFVSESGTNVLITVNRINVNTGPVSVQFFALPGTAVAGADYVGTNGTLSFADGQSTSSFTVSIINQSIVEPDKTVNLILTNPSPNSYVVSPSNAVLNITNNVTGVSFSSPTYVVGERGVQAIITVIRQGVTTTPFTVDYNTTDGTGKAGTNYIATSGTLVFTNGQMSQTFAVTVIDDHIIDGDHSVNLNLLNVQGAVLLNPSSAVLNITEGDGAGVIPAGTALLTPSPSGLINPGQTVTVLFGLRDWTGGNTVNLIATLLNTNGITNAIGSDAGTAHSTYGVLVQNGPEVAKPFTFTAVGTNGQTIIAVLQLQDGGTALGTALFSFTLGSSAASFTNSGLILINDSISPPTMASPYPSVINVSGVVGVVSKVTATISNLNHSFDSDVNALLVGPLGQKTMLISHCGGTNMSHNVTLTFDDFAANNLSSTNPIVSGTNKPTAFGLSPLFPPPAPVGLYPTALSIFQGIAPNGIWSLYVVDDKTLDSGVISNGWSVAISTGVPVPENADLELTMTNSPVIATLSNALTYSFTLTNAGPAGATNVVVTDVLPAGVTYLSNSCGCMTYSNGVVTMTLPALAYGAGVSFSITVSPNTVGFITNMAVAVANQYNPNTNNTATVINYVSPPSADVAVSISATPNPVVVGNTVAYTIVVTNNGPSLALAAMATNIAPAGFVYVSSSVSAGSVSTNGQTIWSIGNLSSAATWTVTYQTTVPGTVLDTVSAGSSTFEPLKQNNFASAKVEVDPPSLAAFIGSKGLTLTWPSGSGNYWVEGTTNLKPPVVWNAMTNVSPSQVGNQLSLPVPTNGYHFFRLRTQLP